MRIEGNARAMLTLTQQAAPLMSAGGRVLAISSLVVAAFMAGFWVLMRHSWAWVAVVFYVLTSYPEASR